MPICWWTLKKIKYSFSVLEEIQRVEKSNLPLLKWGPRLVFPSHFSSTVALPMRACYSGGGATAWPVSKDIELRPARPRCQFQGRPSRNQSPVPPPAPPRPACRWPPNPPATRAGAREEAPRSPTAAVGECRAEGAGEGCSPKPKPVPGAGAEGR